MHAGLALAGLAALTTAGNLAAYYPKMMGNRATLKPRGEQAVMAAAIVFAVAAFASHPGLIGGVVAALASLPAALFLLATFTSGLPTQPSPVAVGTMAPDFEVRDARGGVVRLSDFRGTPVLLKFYRGYWCPYCVAELDQLNRYAADFEKLSVKLIAVSSDRVDELRVFEPKHAWRIRLLADPALTAHRRYNVQHRNFAARRGPFREVAIPTTILIAASGRVLWMEQTSDFRVRPQADMVLAKTRALLGTGAVTHEDCGVCVA